MDDLNDLVWSTSAQQTSKPSPFQSSFDLLAGSSSTSASSPAFYNSTRTVSPQPSVLASAGASRPSIPQSKPQKSTDAFADLFPLGGGTRATGASSGVKGRGALSSMAEEQSRLKEEAARKREAEHKGFESQGEFWDSLGSGRPNGGAPPKVSAPFPPPAQRPQQNLQSQQGSIRLNSTPSLVPSRSSTPQTSRPATSTSTTNGPLRVDPSNVWSEFDLLSSSSTSGPPSSSSATGQRSGTKSTPSLVVTPSAPSSGKTGQTSDPFDFFLNQPHTNGVESSKSTDVPAASGARASAAQEDEDDWGYTGSAQDSKERGGLLQDSEEDDFMSAFNQKPIDARADDSRPAKPTSSSRRASPPPHIVGQLVEMGFTPTQARQALSSTESGLDVQLAASMLLSEGSNRTKSADRGYDDHDHDDEDDDGDERERNRLRLQEEEEAAAAAERRRRRRQGPSRSSVAAGGAFDSSRSATSTPPNEGATTPLQEQAAKILAQTNLLGTSVFNRANAFWKEGKSQVQKAYEERTAAATAGSSRSSTPANDGRPKWMTESVRNDGSDGEESRAQSQPSGFKDEFAHEQLDEDVLPQRTQKERPVARKPAKMAEQPSSLLSAASKIGSLFSTAEDEPKSYVSPNRRPAPRQPSSPLTATAVSRPSPAPPVKPKKTRSIPSVSAASVETALAHKTKGNEFFKLGQFGEAESAYTQAIGSLPDSHLKSIPLYNNRAASRLKNGDHTGSASDSTFVIEMIGLDYHPDKEVPLPSDMNDIILGDGLIKAIVKRANAMELGERWSKAKEDWDLIGRLEINVPGATKIAAMDGSRRCKKMVDLMNGVATPAPAAPSTSSASTIKKKPPVKVTSSTSTGAASALLKATNAALESEDLQRDQHKDSVDARILSWKAGKETNIRALIGSLENVLWPELGWQKVGLHELVTDKQVKVKYTRAVGKVHPDKLNAGNTTVEQRMIANGVFAALNEAWNAGQK